MCNSLNICPENQKWLDEVWEKIQTKVSAECDRNADCKEIPYTTDENGRFIPKRFGGASNLGWWTNGFWSGILWEMYAATKEEKYLKAARHAEELLDGPLADFPNLHHDVGFMWLHSAVADYRLTGDMKARNRGLTAASHLSGRFNPAGKFIRAWNMDRTGWIIVDCMMNIPLLYWASRELNDPRFYYTAVEHADTCLRTVVRDDGSCNHIVILDPDTGEMLDNPAGQGCASGSSWSRGQSWAIYGFTLSYINTGKKEYLDAAKRVSNYFIANVANTSDFVPRVDFRQPSEPDQVDTTAAAIASAGMLELAKQLPEEERGMYVNAAVKMLKALDTLHCDWDANRDAIVMDGTEAYNKCVHIPIIYGDFFFIEAILKLRGSDFLIW